METHALITLGRILFLSLFERMQNCYFEIFINRVTFAEAPPGFFRGGGTPGYLKAITHTPQGIRGAKAPPDGSEVSFFKNSQSIRK